MDLKDKLVSSFATLQEQNDAAHQIRQEAFEQFETLGFPTKKLEAWKYTSLNSVLKTDFNLFPTSATTLSFEDVKPYFVHEIDAYKVVFVDGVFNAELSNIDTEGFEVTLMSKALNDAEHKAVIEKYFNSIAKKDESLTSLNTAFTKEGTFIHIPKSKVADKPIQLLHFATGTENALFLQPRNLVVVEENAQVQIIERHQSLTDNATLTNAVTEMFVAKHANLDYYKIQNDKLTASLIDNTYISQEGQSNASVHTFSFGGKITRNNLNYYQKGEYIDSTLKGITILEGKQHVDHYTLVDHVEPNCESHQNYKGIFAEKSTGVFNGKIYVDKIAQKTNAFQQNNNILLDDTATINTKPQLEIFADDVKCSHGCTIGQLDAEAMFYLKTRGIPEKEAKGLLTYAFANNVLESVRIPELQARVNKLIAEKLGVNLGFDQ
ncbi:Fe-S cluster assembly protein SufD [Pustulibacterium marinum]|uniref:Fe-S cluster assembly protein SufD n=1 Tax=Pustulibacterium marinum TaxID=1224947 RepID=A0A1I7HD17_9FLAO|nr:Fe-S cluster assembly protein SufD [Pustulibacterium marinum]SFU58597.1 Fe-S cluster assembly protein SufD [Pustulibacterium marinum]